MNEKLKLEKLKELETQVFNYTKLIEESSLPKDNKCNNLIKKFNNMKDDAYLLKKQGEIRLALKKIKKALKYAKSILHRKEVSENKKKYSWYSKTSNRIILIQIILFAILFTLPLIDSLFNINNNILSGIHISIMLTILITFFLLVYSFLRNK